MVAVSRHTGSSRGGGRNRKIMIMSWIAFGFGTIAGAALPATFIGATIRWPIAHLPSWVGIAILLAVTVAAGVDIALDGEPNRLALWGAITLPSTASGITGEHGKPSQLATAVTDASQAILDAASGQLGALLGVTSAIGLAVGSMIVALLVSRRSMKRGAS